MKKSKLGLLLIMISMVLLLSGCFEFVTIDQPEVVKAGDKVNVKLSVLLKPSHSDLKYGIIGMLIPTDWTVDSVKYAPGTPGDVGPMNCSALPSGTADADTGGVDYWVDSLEVRYPSSANTHWVVYQGDETDNSALDTAYVDVSLYFTSSATTGDFDLRYFITEASEDFSDETYYEVSTVNPISVTDFTNISDIQDTTGTGNSDSKLKGQTVTFTGIVSAESWAYGGSYYVQDGSGPWSGVLVYDSDRENAYGDSVIITAEVDEYYGKTEMKNVSNYEKISEGHKVAASVVTSGEIGTADSLNAEAYEGVLVKVENVEITDGDLGYGEWSVSDGSGDVRIDDVADYYFWPSEYDSCLSVTGILDYSYDNTKILPRLAYDIVEGNKTGETKIYTRMQRIQQVRYSDLLKAEKGTGEDVSYLSVDADTIDVKGIVTMPTGLSYAGDGIKFILQDTHGGPWSSILSYHSDSTAYPVLFEGDLIEMTGYISEYYTTQSNMTEFFLKGAMNILDYGVATPEPDLVTTGDLRLPKTAEQYGTNMVKIKDAIVTNVDPAYEIMGIDDGSGELLIDDDSDSLGGYIAPPMLTPIDSIIGWVYHHYGSYADSTTYKLDPLYEWDIVIGEGPPALLYPTCTPSLPTSSDSVNVSITISTQRNITEAKVCYRVDQGSYADVTLIEGADNVWSVKMPPQLNSSFVDYFYSATDDSGDVTLDPADTSLSNYNYVVLDGDPTIHDIQYTPWSAGNSPLVGVDVHFTGTVTTNSDPLASEYDDNYGILAIQNGSGIWNGVFVIDDASALIGKYTEGDEVEVWGTVTETFEDDYWQWSANTYVVLDSMKSTGTGTAVETEVTVADLAGDPEAYEGVLVHIADQVTVASINQYDLTITDGTNNYLLDDDCVPDSVFYIEYNSYAVIGGKDTVRASDLITGISGVSIFSYGTHKIEIMKLADFEEFVAVENHEPILPNNYALYQNYPNPFNPSTNIAFDLPNLSDVTIVVYNIRGQMVKVLTKDQFNAGHHVVRWNGMNRYGKRISTGVYIYRIMANNFVDVKKMVYLK
jgi:hypothetical protein